MSGVAEHYQAVVDTPLSGGVRLGLVCTGGGLARIDLLPPSSSPGFVHPSAEAAVRALAAYFSYSVAPEPALDLTGTPFQQRVWEALRGIPAGRTRTYGELATALGSGARAVAAACRANPVPVIVPCHRVVAVGGLGGYMGRTDGPELAIKVWLLDHERAR